jgi:hypothetical protein
MALSASRVGRFTEAVRDGGVEIVGSIPELCRTVDALMIQSLDGRADLPQARGHSGDRREQAALHR